MQTLARECSTIAPQHEELPAGIDAAVLKSRADDDARAESLRALLRTDDDAVAHLRTGDGATALALLVDAYRAFVAAGRPHDVDNFAAPWPELFGRLAPQVDLAHARVDAMAALLNDLGFVLSQRGELHQAAGAYAECQALLDASGRTRPILELNRGDLARDLHRASEARSHYQRYLAIGSPTDAQRRAVDAELAKLPR
jgi:tetratricopeptide (TPR) repeat protein